MKSKKPIITKKEVKVAGVTFALFMTEALMHYHMGRKTVQTPKKKEGIIPGPKTLLHMAAIVGAFSALNGYLLKDD